MLMSFLFTYSFKGIFIFLMYFIVNKLLFLILLIFYIQKIINIGRLVIGFIIYKKDNLIKDKLITNFIKALYIIIFVLILNIVLYFITPFIFKALPI